MCPSCPTNQVCQKTVVFSCQVCPTAYCGKDEVAAATKKSSDGPGAGAIAGAVIGGIVFIAIITYLVWRFCIKAKRSQYEIPQLKVQDEDLDHTSGNVEAEKDFAQRRDQRSSMHTVHSIASTVLTRASNIIQIAYIPGVTNRATPTSPNVLVPPVPPIPLALSNAHSPSPYEEPHFFVPGDLRDSTYSGFSAYTDRTSYARTSYAARTSMAPSVVSAVIPPPPLTGIRGKAAIVSLKSTTGSSGSTTPPVPSIDFEKYGKGTDLKPPPSPGAASTFSVGSTFLNNASASTATQMRPQLVTMGSKRAKVNPLVIKKSNAAPSSPAASTGSGISPSDDDHLTSGRLTMGGGSMSSMSSVAQRERDSAAVTIIDDTEAVEGPFSDPKPSHESSHSLSAVIEEATKRAARGDARGDSGKERDGSPFADSHAMKD